MRIKRYPIDAVPTLSDKVIGTDVDNQNITKNYTISDILNLASTTTTSDNLSILSGSVTWVDGLNFIALPFTYTFNGQTYVTAQESFVLTASDDTLNRKDVFALDATLNKVVVLEGDLAASPSEKTVDFETQIRITAADIDAGQIIPTGVTAVLVYDENAGEPTEWTPTVNETSASYITLADTGYAYSGSSSIKFDSVNDSLNNNVTFVNDATVSSSFSSIQFRLKKADATAVNIRVYLKNAATGVSNVVFIQTGNYGLVDGDITSDQMINIPNDDLDPSGIFDTIVVAVEGVSGATTGVLYIDNVRVISGLVNPVATFATRWTDLQDTDDTFVGKDNYFPRVDEASDKLVLEDFDTAVDEYLTNNLNSINPVENEYADIATMLADQANQTEGYFQYVTDASADPGVTSGDAYYEKLASTTATLATDYIRLSDTETTILENNSIFKLLIVESVTDDATPDESVSAGKIAINYSAGTSYITSVVLDKSWNGRLQNFLDQVNKGDSIGNLKLSIIKSKGTNTKETMYVDSYTILGNNDIKLNITSTVDVVGGDAAFSTGNRVYILFDEVGPLIFEDEGSGGGTLYLRGGYTTRANAATGGYEAIDFGKYFALATQGASGTYSVNINSEDSLASGYGSVTIGGFGNVVSDPYTYALGYRNTTIDYGGLALGNNLKANDANTVVLGQNNVDNTPVPGINQPTQRRLVVGIGDIVAGSPPTSGTRKDGMVLYHNGELVMPELTIAKIDAYGSGKVAVTREWVETEIAATPAPDLQAVTDVGNVTTNGIDAADFNNLELFAQTGVDIDNIGIGLNAMENNTGLNSIGIGSSVLRDNTGNNATAVGESALRNNTVANANAFGQFAMFDNTGTESSGFGVQALRNNTGTTSNGFGNGALLNNTGNYANGFGNNTLRDNTGTQNVAFGTDCLNTNDGDGNTAIGYHAGFDFQDDTGSAQNVADASTDVDTVNERITLTAHGFGPTSSYVNLRYTTTGTNIGGLFDNNIYKFLIFDANTIEYIGNLTTTGTDVHTFTPQFVYDNVTLLGSDAEPTASNQVVLGDLNVTEVSSLNANFLGERFNNLYLSSDNGALRFTSTDLISNNSRWSVLIGGLTAGSLTGDSNTAVGYRAMGNSSTTTQSAAFGREAGENCNGLSFVAIGSSALADVYDASGLSNDYTVAVGTDAGRYGGYSNSVLIGTLAGENSVSQGSIFIGVNAGTKNNSSSISIGQNSGLYGKSIHASNTTLGSNAYTDFTDDTGNAKNVADATTDVDTTNERITITAHGFGANNTFVPLKYTTTGTVISPLTSGIVYNFKIIDANTIEFIGENISTTGTDTHTFTPMLNAYENVTVLGADAEPTASNQVILGNSSVTEVVMGNGEVLNNVKKVKVSLTAANVNNIGTTPITAVAAQGAGTIINVIAATAFLNWGTVAFDNNSLDIEISGASTRQAYMSNFLNSSADTYHKGLLNSGNGTHIDNTALVITGTDSVATGDSTIDVYITYEVIEL
jgi:hypothetical protein